MLAFLNALSPWHLLLILVFALLLFGNRLPEVARSLGRAMNEFKRGLKEVGDDLTTDEPPATTRQQRLDQRPSERLPDREPVARDPVARQGPAARYDDPIQPGTPAEHTPEHTAEQQEPENLPH